METLYEYLIKANRKDYNLKILQRKDTLIIKNNYFVIKLNKVGNRFDMTYLWKLGILHVFFKAQHRKMSALYSEIKSYAQKNDIVIDELHLKYT